MGAAAKCGLLGALIALIGAFASALPPVADLEERFGLDWLFRLRGPRPVPADVAIVSITHDSFWRLGTPPKTRQWPRSRHGQLVQKLVEHGADIIVFDIIFDQVQAAEEDRLFAQAIAEAGNVILFQTLTNVTISVPSQTTGEYQAITQTLVDPIDPLFRAAVDVAPFPLPKRPANVAQVWTFKPGAGDVPTLPVTALFHLTLSRAEGLRARLSPKPTDGEPLAGAVSGHRVDSLPGVTARDLRRRCLAEPVPALTLLSPSPTTTVYQRSLLAALGDVCTGPDSRYLDFYGPPGTVSTYTYEQVMHEQVRGGTDLKDKVIFVGFSEHLDAKDAFYTSFSRSDGVGTSGVEIIATAFANLLERRAVEPIPPLTRLAIIVTWGMGLGALLLGLPGIRLLIVASTAAALYGWGATWMFSDSGAWLPVITPLLVQLPVALVASLVWHYRQTLAEREQIRREIRFYVPNWVVDEMLRGRKEITAQRHLQYGICLASDAQNYTSMSERLDPARLHAVLNRYYQTLFEPITKHGGVISDVIGDAMLAIWATDMPDRATRLNACMAALQILNEVQSIEVPTLAKIPTRLSLHCGEMSLGSVGAGTHYEIRAVGDVVNSCARIEQLNKRLGTWLLASRDVIAGLNEIVTRDVGTFRLPGKRRVLRIFEVICTYEMQDAQTLGLCSLFAEALEHFRARRWGQASSAFEGLLSHYHDDGPSRFYLDLCGRYASEPPPATWDGVISLSKT